MEVWLEFVIDGGLLSPSEEVNLFKSAEKFLLFSLKIKTNSPFLNFTIFNRKRSKSLHRPRVTAEKAHFTQPMTL